MSRRKFDFYLLIPVIFLLGFSVATIASVSPENLVSHLLYIAVAFIFFLIFSFLDLEILFPFSPIIYLSCLGFLILPFLLGTVTRGSVRWIPLGGYTLQPSELVKPFLVLISAWFWSKGEFSFQRLVQFLFLFLPPLALIFLQPDLGSTLVVLSIFAGAILTSGIKVKQLLVLMVIGILLIPVSWFSLHDYQKMRVVHFINPYSDPLGEGYNVIQAKIAVGSGGLFGRGFGRGTQSHLAFLPERHTDFVFASLSEELGLVGSALVLLLYMMLFLKLLKIASGSKQKNFFLLSLGMFFYLFFQTVVNIGMNIGLMPITGITLPLVSYGGSSLLTTMISLGILESVCRQGGDSGLVEIK
jgi:rod shape determining protein RodA